YISPLFHLSSPRAALRMECNIVTNVQVNGGAMLSLPAGTWAAGRGNFFPDGYDTTGYVEDPGEPPLRDAD
ncbi:MAG: hypothetical protein FWF96_05300, partial [Kiritimatiellaeota bacterium]|nr:hypothetical protein [Kiritimatiellota bacterium]